MVAEALWFPLGASERGILLLSVHVREFARRISDALQQEPQSPGELMPGTPAYMVIGTMQNVTTGEALSAQADYYRAGLYLSSSAAEAALTKVKVPSKYMYLSIVRVTVRFYVCVELEADDETMARAARADPKYVPPILSGPFDKVEQAEMMCLLVDRMTWKGALVLAMTDDGAATAKKAS